jgi:hypothetical protein
MCCFTEAIKVFEDRKTDYDNWYMARTAVSLAMIMERTELFRQCDFAIEELKKAQSTEQAGYEIEKQKTIDQRSATCFRDCKDQCYKNICPDGSCTLAVVAAAKDLAWIFSPEDCDNPKPKEVI